MKPSIPIRRAVAIVAAVLVLVYAFLYTTESYSVAVSALNECAPGSDRVAVINPFQSSVTRRGEKGTAEYQLMLFGSSTGPRTGRVGLLRESGEWMVKYLVVDGRPVTPSCPSGDRGIAKTPL